MIDGDTFLFTEDGFCDSSDAILYGSVEIGTSLADEIASIDSPTERSGGDGD
ncbi:hypothetical protein IKG06_01915 [Candidatus Saccharibacteria bacterium]|nr:hypothetical protein [Candidatus Saccharibacteria bacterium]